MHEQLAALSQGPIVKAKKKKEKKEKKKKKKKLEKRSRAVRSKADSEEWKMPGKLLKTKSARAGGSRPKKSAGKKSSKNSRSVPEQLVCGASQCEVTHSRSSVIQYRVHRVMENLEVMEFARSSCNNCNNNFIFTLC